MASLVHQPRIFVFSYHNLNLGAFRVTMWLRESVDPVSGNILSEVNVGGTNGFMEAGCLMIKESSLFTN